MFLQQSPPDTLHYFIAGYVVFFSVMAIYLGSLIVRYRNLKQNLELLEGLDS
ncbi:MAG: hypothetical protein KKD28_01480 [Chloroflexi bacterium]|nr:hypothetical protein [Chloroflexota bacterium]MBU1660125.1 hypothetical protein [Chloroflexota bacterium]